MADEYTLSNTVWARHLLLPTVTPYDGEVPEYPEQSYAVFYPDAGRAFGDRLGGGQRQLAWGWFATLAGTSRQQLMDAVREYRTHFLGYRPDPSDAASPVTEDELGSGIQRDAKVPSDVRLFTVLRFRLTTTRS